jgi:uncharacterized protein YkwD
MRPVPRPAARALLVSVACVLTLVVSQPAPADAMNRLERRLYNAVNRTRDNHGLRRLHVGSTLQTGSHSWARYLLRHDSFYHGRIGSGTSENIGWISCRRHWAAALVRMWLDSYTHRIHLLDPGNRRVGVGVSHGRWSGYNCVNMAVTRFR